MCIHTRTQNLGFNHGTFSQHSNRENLDRVTALTLTLSSSAVSKSAHTSNQA